MSVLRRRQWQAWTTSLAVHAVALLGLALVVVHEAMRPEQLVIETRMLEDTGPPELLAQAVDLKQFLEESSSPPVGPESIDQILASPDVIGTGLATTNLGTIAGMDGKGLAVGGNLAGEVDGLGFFGSRSRGGSVVFVVDMSGSMDNGRFGRAQQELVKAIHRLHVTQKFYVFFFNDGTVPLFFPRSPKELVLATPLKKRSATRWILERRPFGGTEPTEAMAQALELRPDVIYFLTDGEFSETCRDVCRELNQRGTIINTISLESKQGIPLLKAIAEDHKGTFKAVK